jgi:hypothetical protein
MSRHSVSAERLIIPNGIHIIESLTFATKETYRKSLALENGTSAVSPISNRRSVYPITRRIGDQ